MSKAIFHFLLLTWFYQLSAQPEMLKISSKAATTAGYLKLMESNPDIRDNVVLNETLLDLVDVYLTDSIIKRKTERHRVIGGGIARMFGFRWQTINWKKEKFIGTTKGGPRISKEERLTEYDVNFNMTAHLKRYIDLAYQGYQRQKEIGKEKKKKNYADVPYIYPSAETDLDRYDLHNELTPPRPFRPMLNEMFYPTARGTSLQQHPNFGEPEPTLGMFGAFVSDCNHSCHPEIHPYEWLWWLNLNPALDALSSDPDTRVSATILGL